MPTDIGAKIVACIEKFVASGGKIIQNDWNIGRVDNRFVAGEHGEVETLSDTPERPACCPLGAVLVAQDPSEWPPTNSESAARALGVDEYWVASFVAAIDDDTLEYIASPNQDAFELGRKIREKYVED